MKPFAFTGRRGLSALCTLILATQVAGCGGSDSGGTSAPTPPPSGNNPPPPPPPPLPPPEPEPEPETVALTLTGKVTDEPIANAEVTATVGTETFTTTAGSDGAYSLEIEIEEANVSEFVTLSARGVGEQAFVEFTSLAGSFQSLVTAAGDDDTLSSSENFSTQITNVSTAQAVFMRETNDGKAIVSDADLQSLKAAVNAQDVLDLAAAIKLAVDDTANNPLPEGQTSILALASDAAARQDFVNEVYANNPDAFAAAQVAIAQDPDLAQPLEADVIEAYLANEGFTTALLSSDAAFSFNYSGRVSHFDLHEGGVGSESSDTYDQEFTWTIEGSTIKVTYTEPLETFSWDSAMCGDVFGQYQGRYVTDGARISFLNERTVAITTTSDITYASCPQLDKEDDASTVARTVMSMDNFDVIDMEEKYGQAQTIYVWDSTRGAVVADVAEISADGNGRTLLTNMTFTWELNADGGPEEEGKIVQLNFSNGSQAEYLSSRDVDDLASDIFWEIRTSETGPVFMGAGASIFADPAYAVTEFTTEDVVGRYYQFGIGEEVSGDPRLKGFRLRFDADGTGAQEEDFIDTNGNAVTLNETVPDNASRAFRWSIEEGPVGIEVVVRRTWDLANQHYNCVYDGVNPDCVLFDERRIIPIVVNDTGRYYWLEVRRVSEAIITEDTPTTHLVRFYDYKSFEEEPVSASLKGRFAPKANKPRELLRGPQLR
jgi:hypothetical protein